jgi:hypothetical protein
VAGGLRRISKAEECKGEKLGNAMQCAAIGDRKAHLTLAIYFVMDESLGGLDEVCDEVPLTNWGGESGSARNWGQIDSEQNREEKQRIIFI